MADNVRYFPISYRVRLTKEGEGIKVTVSAMDFDYRYKVDLPNETVTTVLQQLYAEDEVLSVIEFSPTGLTLLVKTSEGVAEIFRAISSQLLPPQVTPQPAPDPVLATVTSGSNVSCEPSEGPAEEGSGESRPAA